MGDMQISSSWTSSTKQPLLGRVMWLVVATKGRANETTKWAYHSLDDYQTRFAAFMICWMVANNTHLMDMLRRQMFRCKITGSFAPKSIINSSDLLSWTTAPKQWLCRDEDARTYPTKSAQYTTIPWTIQFNTQQCKDKSTTFILIITLMQDHKFYTFNIVWYLYVHPRVYINKKQHQKHDEMSPWGEIGINGNRYTLWC